jgi:hypothetical protein
MRISFSLPARKPTELLRFRNAELRTQTITTHKPACVQASRTELDGLVGRFTWTLNCERTKRYGGRVNRNLAKRTCAVAWLLCAILSYHTINPPHCDVCDRIFLVYASSLTSVHQHTPTAPDTCNGLCSCCGLQGVPISSTVQVAVNSVTRGNPPELPWPALTPASSVFRPPRLAVFS